MKIKVIKTFTHLSGGKTYEKGKTYDVAPDFAEHVLAVGPYIEIAETKPAEKPAAKAKK